MLAREDGPGRQPDRQQQGGGSRSVLGLLCWHMPMWSGETAVSYCGGTPRVHGKWGVWVSEEALGRAESAGRRAVLPLDGVGTSAVGCEQEALEPGGRFLLWIVTE